MSKRVLRALFFIGLLLSLVACGSKADTSAQPQGAFSNIPQGSGDNYEPGTAGQFNPSPNGHIESLLSANDLLYAGSDNGQVYALDPASGHVRWQRRVSSSSVQSPNNQANLYPGVVDQRAVYAMTPTGFYALGAGDGRVLWHVQTVDQVVQAQLGAGALYVSTAASGDRTILTALRTSDGMRLWSVTQHTARPSWLGATADGNLYQSLILTDQTERPSSETLEALRASDGTRLWSVAIPIGDGLLAPGPQFVGGIVYLTTDQGSVYALRASTGAEVWHVSQAAPSGPGSAGFWRAAGTLTLTPDVIYSGTPTSLRAYGVSDGHLLWQYQTGAFNVPGPWIALQVDLMSGVLYYRGANELGAVQASDGKLLWRHTTQINSGWQPQLIADGHIIDNVGTLFALRPSDGKQLWQRQISIQNLFEGQAPSYALSGERLIVGGDDGSLQAFGLKDGASLWRYQIKELPVQGDPVYAALVTFTKSTSLQQALVFIANLGLKLDVSCPPGYWQSPIDVRGFAQTHQLFVGANTNSAPLWAERLSKAASVSQVETMSENGFTHGCPLTIASPVQEYLVDKQVDQLQRVTFKSATPYAQALQEVMGLGFVLADPCYRQARAQSHKPSWHAMDQQASFAHDQTLLVSTTHLNSVHWQAQLQSEPGVQSVASRPPTQGC